MSGLIKTVIFEPSLLIFLGIILVIILISLFLILRLSRIKNLLEAKQRELETSVEEHISVNTELTREKEMLARELADSERLYAILIESATDGISFYDRNNKLILTNTAFYSILGMTREEYDELTSEQLLHPECRDFTQQKLKALVEKGSYLTEIRIRHKSGHYIVLSTTAVQIRNDSGEIIGSLSISRDITEMKKTEQELINAKEMAENSNRLKSSFLANISHEIRTPLNSVVGFSNLLVMDDITRDQKVQYSDLINYNSEKLLQIIGDIIDLSRLESSQMEISYDETSINDVIKEVTGEIMNNIKHNEKQLKLSIKNELVNVSDLIFTDRMWLKRVLRHLLDNAVKFTLEGEVELRYELDGKNLLFTVRDTGIGISYDSLGRIFEQFNQEASGHHRPFEGLGIGLTLAKQVIDRMGGQINVSSEKGIGSQFSFTIPYRPAGTPRQSLDVVRKTRIPSSWGNVKCLVVDDNKDVVLYLTRILIDAGVHVVTARSGMEALEHLKTDSTINMVLLDMQMPEMNGIETAREIRKIRSAITIIAQTAYVFEEDKKEVLQAGCDACLVKPIRRDNLISVMSAFALNK